MTLVHFGRCARRGQFRPLVSVVFEFMPEAKVCRQPSMSPRLSPARLIASQLLRFAQVPHHAPRAWATSSEPSPQSPPASPAPAAADSSDEEAAPARSRPPPQLPSTTKRVGKPRPKAMGGTSCSPPMVATSKKRGKDGIAGATNSGEVPSKEPALPQEGRPSRSRGAAIGAADRLTRAELQAKVQAKVATAQGCEGHCWWCFCQCVEGEGMHDPDKCSSREETVDLMSDWDLPQSRVTVRLSRAESAAPKRRGVIVDGRGRVQSMLSDKDRKARKQERNTEQRARRRARDKAAQDRLRAWLKERREPISACGPLGQYTFYQKIAIDFALHLDRYMSEAQMQSVPGSLDRAAVQRFAGLAKAAGIKSLEKARQAGEGTITGFVALRSRLLGPLRPDYEGLVTAARAEELIKYGSLAEVKALPSTATLLDIVSAVRKVKEGRRPKEQAGRSSATSGVRAAENWADGRPRRLDLVLSTSTPTHP